MQKLLYIAPHLSTGGLPQYLTKKIELIKDEFEIYLIEWVDCTGGRLVVTKNKIVDLVDSNKFFTLGEDKSELFNIIDKISPDIIHLEEIPEFFMDDDIARKLYSVDREYFIVESSHDSSYNTDNKLFTPDKFMFVSNWQIDQYNNIDIPKILVEYPIEYVDRPNREDALKHLNLDPSKKHILHIGLFTSRKNQKEFFEYARALPEYEFHSVGNQADNFKWYWEPLMQDKPHNLTWWDERSDVDSFYKSMDLFLFTSRGNKNDKETMPLVIREAISHQIPIMIYNLEVYQDYFDSYDGVNYLDFNSFKDNVKKIKIHLGDLNNIVEEEEAYVVCTYPNTQAIVDTTIECIKSLRKNSKRKIIISSHGAVPKELQDMVDYVFYERNNLLTKHTYYSNYTCNTDLFNTHINLKGEDNDRYHGPACYTSFYNPATFAKGLGIHKLHYINFDYLLKDETYINYTSDKLNTHDTFFGENTAQEGKCYYTYFFSARPEAILKHCKFIETEDQYNNLMHEYGSESNGIENLYYHIFKNNKNNYIEPKEKFDSDALKYFEFEDYSMVEYYTILPTNSPSHFCPWVTISNNTESKLIHYTVKRNGNLIIDRKLEVKGKFTFWDMVPYSLEDNTIVNFYVTDLTTGEFIKEHTFKLDKDYFNNKIINNGSFTWKGDMTPYNPKIKLLHLVTEPDTNEKEQRSIENLKSFCDHTNIKYDMRVNKIWKDLPPSDTCQRPEHIDWKPAPIGNGFGKLTPGHYGCYLAHKNAICLEDNKNYDFVLIFEGDTIVESNFNELHNSLLRFNRIANEQELDVVGFGNPKQTTKIVGPQIEDVHCNAILFVPAQSYLIPNQSLSHWKEKLQNKKWEAWDLWIMNVGQMKSGIADKVYTKQLPGFSIIDQKNKSKNDSTLHKLIYTEDQYNNLMHEDDMAPYNPKIKLLHLVTEPKTNKKEQRSIENLKSFCNHTGITYDMRVNKIWKDLPPSDTCQRPEHIDWKPAPIGNGFGKLTPGHYGCYLAHKNAICLEDNKNYDFVLIFEGDTIVESNFNELHNSLLRFNRIANEQELDVVGFGNPKQITKIVGPQIEDVHCNCNALVPAQSYLIPTQKLNNWKEKLKVGKWEAWDLWIWNVGKMKIGIADKVYTKHLPGFSIIDQENKSKNDNAIYKLIFTD
mgnify:CR=1 FL=1